MLRIGRSLLFASILLLLTTSLLWAAAEEPYQEIDVRLPAGSSLQQLLQIHPDLEVMNLGDGDVRLLSRPSLTEKIEQQGWSVEIVHPDLESFYVQRNPPVLDYGVWHTYQETIDELNLLHSQYPNLTTAPFSIGTTGEGRQIWAIKVSDNPNADEDEPEVLYDGVHHAREIMTVEMCLYFPRYLCENYGTDPLATFLVDNREIWFVPIFNVDGFVYNELTNPNGGGMWRKNRRNNGGGCYGVDVNRNYPYEWGYGGGSGYPCDETYWGPSAASEPENQAMINLMNDRHFVVQDSWHSVAGLILFSWGYTLQHTPDDALLRAVGQERSRDNGYVVGQPPEVLYSVNGGMNDYAYGAHHIFSYTTEFGGSGFWPNQSEREGLLAENLHSILYLTQVAGPSIGVQSLVVSGGNGKIEPGETVDMVATIVNDGIFSDLTNLSIQLRCDDPYITLIDATNPLGTLGAGETVTNAIDPFQVHAETICPQGRMVTFTVVANADGGVRIEVPFEFEIGSLPVIVSNDFETTGGAWQQDVTHTATTGAWVRVDPVQTPHQPGDDTTPAPGVNAWITAQNPTGDDGTDDVDSGISASRSPDFNLAGHGRVRLSLNYFMGQRDNGDDPNGDFFRIDVSPDAGATWVNLLQLGDVAMLPEWRNLRVDLNDFIPMTSQVRLRVQASDALPANDIVEAGIDDLLITEGGVANDPPSIPTPQYPLDGTENVPTVVTFVVGNATDPEGDTITYGFQVFSDADLTQYVTGTDGVPQDPDGSTSWTVPAALNPGTYWWRAYASDPNQRGICTAPARFVATDVQSAGDLGLSASGMRVEPNPTTSGVKIRYLVPSTTTSRLAVYDSQGRLVRELPNAPSAAGWHEVAWDGKDDQGRAVASGSYWVRLWTPGQTRTIRVVRID